MILSDPPSPTSGPVLQLLANGLQFWLRQQCDVQGHLNLQLHGSALNLLRGRLVVPEGFREFLGVEPGGDLVVVGAAVCVELWRPDAWQSFIAAEMPQFRERFDQLTS